MSYARVLRRILFWLTAILLFLLLLALSIAGFAISTETGLNGLLALAQRVLPGQLSYDKASGRLIGPLRIEKFRYADGPLQVALASGELDWQPADLFEPALTVTHLHFAGLELALPPGEDEETPPSDEPFVLPDIQLPLAITVADLQGRNIRIQPAGVDPIVIDAVNLKVRTQADGVQIEVLEARSPLGEVQLSGQANPTGAYPLQLKFAWKAITPDYGTFNGSGELSGTLRDQLKLTHQVTGMATLELNGEVQRALVEPAWSAQVKLTVADLKPFVPDLAGKPLSVQLDAKGVMARFEGRGEIKATTPEIGPATLRFTAAGDEKAVRLDALKLTAANHPLTLDAKGDFQYAELRFDASGQWQSLVWPLTGPAQVESAKGEFTAKGTPQDYQFQLAADLQGPDIPKGRWKLTGEGSDQAVRKVKLAGETLEGTIEGTVDATWTPKVGWQATLAGTGLNPGAQWKEIPGKLNLRLKSDGGLNGKLRANVLLEELAGTLSGQALRGNADISVLDQDLTIKALQLTAGAAQLEAAGALTQRWDLRWKLNAPQLKSLVPGLSGSVASTGQLSGSRDRPQVAANFTVRDLRQGDTQIQQLQGEARIDTGGANRSQVKLTGQGLVLGGQRWKSVSLDGGGTPDAHQLNAELAGDPGRFALALAGKLQLPTLVWEGRITQLTAKDTVAGTWSLDKAVAVQASAQKAGLDNACLASAPTRLCVQGQWNGASGFNGRVQLQDLRPERFKAFFPPGMNLTTRINADANISGQPNGALQGKANLDIAPGNLSMVTDGRTLRFTLNGGSLRAQTDGRTATAQVKVDLAKTGQLQADARVQDPLGAARLNGNIKAAITDLSLISVFAPQVQDVKGQVQADMNITGAIPKLVLRGAIRLENAGATLPDAGLILQDLQFAATSNGQGPLQLTGSVQSGQGQLRLSGTVDPLKPQLILNIQGQDFQAFDTPDIRVQISPDLKLDISQEQVRVDGQVTVPKAYLNPGGIDGGGPSAVNSSEDLVIVKDANGQAKPPSKGPAIFAQVRVILGDDVQVDTPAFQGKLKGNVLVVQTPGLAPRASGSAEVVAGKYNIYGTEIDIQRGRVLFSNSLLDNPGLDMRVAREFSSDLSDNTTVGAQVQGTLKKPQLTLFSNPSMPQSDILSYLVLGRASQGGESAMMFKAASAMGIGGGALAKGLGGAVGLDNVNLDTGTNGKDASLTLGKYLTPDLYVGYGVGLLDAVNTIFIKYRLFKGLMFESNSSATGYGADLTYSWER